MKKKKKYLVLGLGAKYSGRCVGCKQATGSREFELADTILLRDPALSDTDKGRFAVAHPLCIGIQTKSAVGGGRKIRGLLPESVEVKA